MRILLDYLSFSNYLYYGFATIAIVVILTILCFRKTPFISILFALFGIFIGVYIIYIPQPLLLSVINGYNRQILYTNNPEKQKILSLDKIKKNNIHYSIYNQNKACFQKDIKKVKQGTFLYGIWNSISKIKYNRQIIAIGKCSTFVSKNIEVCDKLSINKCLDNFYNKYYF